MWYTYLHGKYKLATILNYVSYLNSVLNFRLGNNRWTKTSVVTIADGHILPSCQSWMDTNFRLVNQGWTQTCALTITDGHKLPLYNRRWTQTSVLTITDGHICSVLSIMDGHQLASWQSQMDTHFRLDNHRWAQTSILSITDGHKLPLYNNRWTQTSVLTIPNGHKLPSWQSQMDTNFRLDNHRWTQTSVLTIPDGHNLPSWPLQMDTNFSFTITDGHTLPSWQSQMDTNFRLNNHRWTQTSVLTITDEWRSSVVKNYIQEIGFFGVAGYPSRAPTFTPGLFSVVHIAHLFNLCVVVLCVFTFWVPCCDISA